MYYIKISSKLTKEEKMRVVLFIGLLFFISWGAGGSQGPFFWTAEKDGKTHHILGTMHVNLDFEDLQCFEVIKNRLKNSHVLFTELSMDKVVEDMEKEAGQDTQTREERTFWKTLTKEEKVFLFRKSIKYMETIHPDVALDKTLLNEILKFIETRSGKEAVDFLKASCNLEKQQNKAQEALDNQVFQFAVEHSINRLPLETAEVHYQFLLILQKLEEEFISSLDESLFKESISKAKENFDGFCLNVRSETKKSDQLYEEMAIKVKNGDLEVVEYSIDTPLQNLFSKYAQYNIPRSLKENYEKNYRNIINQKGLKERNEKWLPKILSAHNSYNNVFVAAGVSHFIGEYDVLNLLKKEGFVIKRFSSECQ